MSLKCYNHGYEHTHAEVVDVLLCYNLIDHEKDEHDRRTARAATSTSIPVHTPLPPKTALKRPAKGPLAAPTDAQLEYIEALGGDASRAAMMTRAEASAYIDALKSSPRIAVPAAPVLSVEEEEKPEPPDGMEADLLGLLADGYYAVKLEEDDPWKFIYVSRPSHGRFKGSIKIQLQHGSIGQRYTLIYVVWPDSKKVTVYNRSLKDHVSILIVNQTKAMRDYSEQMKRCCRCNADLTDPRSLWYGIGPECEKSNKGLIEDIGLEKGFFEDRLT